MQSRSRPTSFTILSIFLTFTILYLITGCARKPKDHDYSTMILELFDLNGTIIKPIEAIESGDSLSIGFRGLSPSAPVQVYLNDDMGKEWSYARLFADKSGNIEPTLFWYHTGVIGTTSRTINFKPDPAFVTFEEAEAYFEKHPLKLTVKDLRGRIIGEKILPFKKRQSPMVYPSNKEGVLVNAFNLAQEDIYATEKNFPAGSTVQLFAVINQYLWNIGDRLVDISGKGGGPEVETIALVPNQTSFTVKIWDHPNGRPGSFDIVARVDKEIREPALRADDILSYGEDTGMIFYIIINGNIVIESAGRMRSAPAKF